MEMILWRDDLIGVLKIKMNLHALNIFIPLMVKTSVILEYLGSLGIEIIEDF